MNQSGDAGPSSCSLLAMVWRQGPLPVGWIRSGSRDNSQGFCLDVWNHGAVFSWIRVGCKNRGLGCLGCDATGHPCTDVRQAVGFMSAEMWGTSRLEADIPESSGSIILLNQEAGWDLQRWRQERENWRGPRTEPWAPQHLVHAFQSEGCSSLVDYDINWEDNRQYFFLNGLESHGKFQVLFFF